MRLRFTRRIVLRAAGAVAARALNVGGRARADDGDIVILPLLSATFAESLTAPAFVAVTRTILPPGTSMTSGDTPGPRLLLVESGEVSIQRGEGNSGFLRAADASPSMAGGGGVAEQVLYSAETYRMTQTDAVNFANNGGQAAIYLDLIVFPKAPLGIGPFTTMDGVVVDPLVGVVTDAMPIAPIQVRVDRLELTQGATIDLPSMDGPRLIVVESGTLGVSVTTGQFSYSSAAGLTPGSNAGRSRLLSAGDETLLRARGSVVVNAAATGALRNLGRNSLSLFWVQLQSVASLSQP